MLRCFLPNICSPFREKHSFLMVFAHILVFGDKIGGKIFLFPFFQGDFLNFLGGSQFFVFVPR